MRVGMGDMHPTAIIRKHTYRKKFNNYHGFESRPLFQGSATSAGFVLQKRGEKIPSKFHLLFNKRWHRLPPFLSNEPSKVLLKRFI
jgi:hypothetical protein